MKARLTRTSSLWGEDEVIEVSSLNDLLALSKKHRAALVVSNSYDEDTEMEIEIYDDYRE